MPSFITNPFSKYGVKQWVDITLFTGVVFVAYNYGKKMAKFVDTLMPSEEMML